MTDNKLTDNEIIKAFEECIASTKNIKYGAKKMAMVDVELLKNTLDLIKCKDDEIYRLKEVIIMGRYTSPTAIRAQQSWFRQNSECINRLKSEIEKYQKHIDKEFAERLKNEAYKNVGIDRDFLFYDSDDNFITFDSVADVIDFLSEIVIKEMVGDAE